jgi:hypothetical protein
VFEAVQGLVTEQAELERELAEPAIHADPIRAKRVGQRYAEVSNIVRTYSRWLEVSGDLEAAEELADESFDVEAEQLGAERDELAERLQRLLVPRDPADDKDAILEVKAGEGGEESALFAGDLLRMYLRHAERRGWSTEVLDAADSDLGGYKSVTVGVKAKGTPAPGEAPYARLKYEGGVHRVQRVPVTESQGRIHTSAAGVLVVPEADVIDVTVNDADLRIDVFRSSGPGGRASTPPTPPYASPICPRGWWSAARTRRASCRTRSKPAHPALPPAGRRAGVGCCGRIAGTPYPGAHGGSIRASAHVQLPGEPDRRPPGRLQGPQSRPGARRSARRGRRRPRRRDLQDRLESLRSSE